MRVIDKRNAATSDVYFEADPVKGKRVERFVIDNIGIACRGVIVGRVDIYTEGGGLVHAVLIEPTIGHTRRAVYLDREINAFVSCEVPS